MIEDVQSEIQCLFADSGPRQGRKITEWLPQFQSRLEEIKMGWDDYVLWLLA